MLIKLGERSHMGDWHQEVTAGVAHQVLDMSRFLEEPPSDAGATHDVDAEQAELAPRVANLLAAARQEALDNSMTSSGGAGALAPVDPPSVGPRPPDLGRDDRARPTRARPRGPLGSARWGWAAAVFFAALSALLALDPGRQADTSLGSFANPLIIELGTAEDRGVDQDDSVRLRSPTRAL